MAQRYRSMAQIRRYRVTLIMHARPRQTDGRIHGRTEEHHGNIATIRSNERIAR